MCRGECLADRSNSHSGIALHRTQALLKKLHMVSRMRDAFPTPASLKWPPRGPWQLAYHESISLRIDQWKIHTFSPVSINFVKLQTSCKTWFVTILVGCCTWNPVDGARVDQRPTAPRHHGTTAPRHHGTTASNTILSWIDFFWLKGFRKSLVIVETSSPSKTHLGFAAIKRNHCCNTTPSNILYFITQLHLSS